MTKWENSERALFNFARKKNKKVFRKNPSQAACDATWMRHDGLLWCKHDYWRSKKNLPHISISSEVSINLLALLSKLKKLVMFQRTDEMRLLGALLNEQPEMFGRSQLDVSHWKLSISSPWYISKLRAPKLINTLNKAAVTVELLYQRILKRLVVGCSYYESNRERCATNMATKRNMTEKKGKSISWLFQKVSLLLKIWILSNLITFLSE